METSGVSPAPTVRLIAVFLLGAFLATAASRRYETLAPVRSHDGALLVYTKDERVSQMRPSVLVFATRVEQELQRAFHRRFSTPDNPLIIVLGNETNGATNVHCRVAPGGKTRIDLPAPETCDLDAFRDALIRGLCSISAQTDAFPPARATALGRAIARAQVNGNPETLIYATPDFETVWSRWTEARLPPAQELLDTPTLDQPLAAVLARWLLTGKHPLITLEAYIRGQTPQLPPDELDTLWDSWLLQTAASVFDPGVATKEALQRWTMSLLVWPADANFPCPNPWTPRTLAWLIPRAQAPAVRRAAKQKALTVRIPAIGRGKALDHLAADYAAWLNALSDGTDTRKLAAELRTLEARRRTLEAQLEHTPFTQR